MKSFQHLALKTFWVISVLSFGINGLTHPAFADDNSYGIGVSPMKEQIVLDPGEVYSGSFMISNPASNTSGVNYEVRVSPFYATEAYDITYEQTGDYNQIVDWITLGDTSGVLLPNSTQEIKFKIDVPKDAPAGGQYAAIIVQSRTGSNESNAEASTGIRINQAMGVAHTIFAEITGTTKRDGEIVSTNLPSFLTNGKIVGSSTISNTGNVHGTAKYKMQVFPLFSGEEVFTNEEDPETSIILPDRTHYHETVWSDTPPMGIFNVVYTTEYEGLTNQVSKLIIICPVWLLSIIVFAVIALIVWIIIRVKSRKKA